VSEQIVEVNEAICEARPPNPAASASSAATGDEKGTSKTVAQHLSAVDIYY
jgi:hypothetical protein